MELYHTAALREASAEVSDWTREHGYAEKSVFPFPDLYLDGETAALLQNDSAFGPFLEDCLDRFAAHQYGHLSSLDQVENFLQRDVHRKNTWMRGNYPSEKWGEVALEIFFDMGLFHLNGPAPRELALAQAKKEREQ